MKTVYTLFLAVASLSAVYADMGVDVDDVPATCQAICRPTIELSTICNVDEDLVGGELAETQAEKACYCSNQSFDVARMTALCQSCVQQNALEVDDRDGPSSPSLLFSNL